MNLQQLADIGLGAIFPIELTTPKDSEGNDQYIEELVDPINFTLTPSSLYNTLRSKGYTPGNNGIYLSSNVKISDYITIRATATKPVLVTTSSIILVGTGTGTAIQLTVPTGGGLTVNVSSGDAFFSSDSFDESYDITPSNVQARIYVVNADGTSSNTYLTLASATSGVVGGTQPRVTSSNLYVYANSGSGLKITRLVWKGNKTQTRLVKKVGWYPRTGLDLVKNNLTAIFTYQIGERFREENFGSRLWECIEEQNTQLLSYMATNFIKQSLYEWESRIRGLKVECTRDGSKLFIKVSFAVDTSAAAETILEYDNSTNTSYAY